MPATALTATTVKRDVANGVDLTVAGASTDSTNTNSFVNDGKTLLRVKNTNAATRDVTVFFQGTATPNVDGVTLSGTSAGRVYTIPATTGDRLLGPFPIATYGTSVIVDYTADAGLTVYVYQLTD